MEVIIWCRDVGFDCNGVVNAPTEKEALRLAIEHAQTVHGVKEISPEIMEKIRTAMSELPPPSSPK